MKCLGGGGGGKVSKIGSQATVQEGSGDFVVQELLLNYD